MKLYVVVDTNVFVSAFLSHHDDAATVQLVRRMIRGEFTPLYSEFIMREYRDVLYRDKFDIDPAEIEHLLRAVKRYGIRLTPSLTGELLIDEKDLPFYEVVMDTRENDSYLVTGNLKHFPTKPFIVSVRQMLSILDDAHKLF